MTSKEKNRTIAEWLGIDHAYHRHEVATGKLPLYCIYCGVAKRFGRDNPQLPCRPDFFTDEAANALVLNELARCFWAENPRDGWPEFFDWLGDGLLALFGADRPELKIAICEAALAYIATLEKKV